MSWEANVRKVEPYVAGEQPKDHDIIKLNTNECPYPPAPGVAKRAEEMNCGDLRLYPDMNAEKLVNSLSEYYHVDPAKIFVGVGSDDVLRVEVSGNVIPVSDAQYSVEIQNNEGFGISILV